MAGYRDRWIECTDTEILIKGYYFPWGTKRIPYAAVKGIRRVGLSATRGQWRVWGTANPRYWASFDPRRPSKQIAFIVDLGRLVHPFVTPDDPEAFEAALRQHVPLDPSAPETSPGPVV